MKVKATKQGFIYGLLKKVGDEFTLVDTESSKAKDQFSSKWMEEIKQPKKKRATSKKEA
jgi:hypothetical protein